MIKRFGFAKTLLVFILFASGLALFSGTVSFFSSKTAMTNLAQTSKNGIDGISLKTSLLKLTATAHSNVLAALAEKDKDSRDLRLELVKGYMDEIQKVLTKCDKDCGTFSVEFKKYFDTWGKIQNDHLSKADIAGAVDLAMNQLSPASETLFDHLDKQLSEVSKVTDESLQASVKSSEKVQLYLLTLTLFTFVFTVIAGFLFRRKVVLYLSTVTEHLEENVAQAKEMSSALAANSDNLSRSSERQAASTEETAASLEEISSMVNKNAENAKVAAKLSSESSDSASKGEVEINKLIKSMHEISDSSKKIKEIINVIDDIAFQTNLLALNAAVEAARAGEQGKGFAVVADAVRSLAQRSAEAAREISELIQTSVSQIDVGTKMADSSGAVLTEILQSIKKVSDLNNEISVASNEQAQGIQLLSTAMNDFEQSTQTNTALSMELSSSSEQLAEQAKKLEMGTEELSVLLRGDGIDRDGSEMNGHHNSEMVQAS